MDVRVIDELLDEVVDQYLNDYEEQVKRNEQTAAILTTVGTVTEKFGVCGSTQLAMDIAKNPPILGNVTSNITNVLVFVSVGAVGLLGYKYLFNKHEEEMA